MPDNEKKIMSYQDWDLMQKSLRTLSDMLSAGKITEQQHQEMRRQVLNGTSSNKLPD